MIRIRLVHWKEAEQGERLERLRAAGFRAAAAPADGAAALRDLRDDPPDAIVVDLGRLPSHGREIGNAIRQQKSLRAIPLVFVGGAPEKAARVRALLPDAAFAEWEEIGDAVRRALARAPAEPVVPPSVMAGYSGTPLPKKLGIAPGATVALLDAPPDFAATLGALPDGVSLRADLRAAADPILLFVRSRRDLVRGLDRVRSRVSGGRLWIAWPKKASGVATDVGDREVRAEGLARGLVDYKVAAIDATWSGLLFTPRKKPAP